MLNKLLSKVKPMPGQEVDTSKAQEEMDHFQFMSPELTQEDMAHECADSLLKVEANLSVLKEIAVAVIENPKHRESVLKVCVDGAAMHTCLLHAIKNRVPKAKAQAIDNASMEWINASDAYISRLVAQ